MVVVKVRGDKRQVVSYIMASFLRHSLRKDVIVWHRQAVEDAGVILAAEEVLFGQSRDGLRRLTWAMTASAQAKEFKTGRAVVRYDPRLDRHT